MSRYLYNAGYYWELVVDQRSPDLGLPVYLEERSTGRRTHLRTVPTSRDLEPVCRAIQNDFALSEEEFEAKYGVRITASQPAAPDQPAAEDDPTPSPEPETDLDHII